MRIHALGCSLWCICTGALSNHALICLINYATIYNEFILEFILESCERVLLTGWGWGSTYRRSSQSSSHRPCCAKMVRRMVRMRRMRRRARTAFVRAMAAMAWRRRSTRICRKHERWCDYCDSDTENCRPFMEIHGRHMWYLVSCGDASSDW